jgi:hypothetical protein
LGTIEFVPDYEYFCYCSNLKGLDSLSIHRLYGGRAECENSDLQTWHKSGSRNIEYHA